MCGLAGIVLSPTLAPAESMVRSMGRAVKHRGPDAGGVWMQENLGIAHQRLSVLDLSADGHQPMTSHDNRYVLAFNGEIYNYEALRKQLPARDYRSRSDTEVLLHALCCWGVEKTLDRLVGMFAFVFVDNLDRQMFLVRDRVGIKPLYYGWHRDRFLFGSELHSIEAACESRPPISRDALSLMMRHNYLPTPYCIYEGFHKLPPASYLQVPLDRVAKECDWPVRKYWNPLTTGATVVERSDSEWQGEMHDRLRTAVRDRLVSDVPLGAFLSGGVDSTLVVALMKEQSTGPVDTYTVGFDDQRLNEATFAAESARHLGTRHHELYVSEQHVLDAVEQLPQICDEPFADQSILPTYLLCKMARQDVTVALTGDGGDELFWGYARYPIRERLDRLRQAVPGPVRPFLSRMLSLPALGKTLGRLPTPSMLGRPGRLADKISATAALLGMEDEDSVYRHLISHWKEPDRLVLGANEPSTLYQSMAPEIAALPVWKRMCVLDFLAYLPDDCLTKVDRASMQVALEARVPLLDHRVVELAYQLPEHLVRQGGTGKTMLRRILDEYIPRAMMDRPKSGFGVPLAVWLRGPLREWAADLLNRATLEDHGYFDPNMVLNLWQEHQDGTADWSAYLWDVLMFSNWDRARSN